MASSDTGGSQPLDDHSGVSFLCELQIPRNAPKSYVELDSPGVDTSVVPDVLGLRVFYDDDLHINGVLVGCVR